MLCYKKKQGKSRKVDIFLFVCFQKMDEKIICDGMKNLGYYRTPELNDRLYLHFKGYRKIENLESFTAVTVLWLENNCIQKIENLNAMKKLNSLYLHNNLVSSIGTHLTAFRNLETLNLANNALTTIEGVENLFFLKKLNVSGNSITSLMPLEDYAAAQNDWEEDIALDDEEAEEEEEEVEEESQNEDEDDETADKTKKEEKVPRSGQQLDCLDVSHNKLEDEVEVLRVVGKLTRLTLLYLHKNKFLTKVKNYRKVIIATCKGLKFLDDYPVFDEERRCCERFAVDGTMGEKAERNVIRDEKEEKYQQQRQFFERLVQAAKDRRASLGEETVAATTPYFKENSIETAENDDSLRETTSKMEAAVSVLQELARANPSYRHTDRQEKDSAVKDIKEGKGLEKGRGENVLIHIDPFQASNADDQHETSHLPCNKPEVGTTNITVSPVSSMMGKGHLPTDPKQLSNKSGEVDPVKKYCETFLEKMGALVKDEKSDQRVVRSSTSGVEGKDNNADDDDDAQSGMSDIVKALRKEIRIKDKPLTGKAWELACRVPDRSAAS